MKNNNNKNIKIETHGIVKMRKEYYTKKFKCTTKIHEDLLNDGQEETDTIQIDKIEKAIKKLKISKICWKDDLRLKIIR